VYKDYALTTSILEQAEKMSDEHFKVVVKWRKLQAGNKRSYRRCLAPPLQLQISGSGLVAPCGMFFHGKYYKYHIGNLHDKSFRELWESERYWDVMEDLGSCRFNAQAMCGCLCLQDACNIFLDSIWDVDGVLQITEGDPPSHINFV
jgi:MoaA/NifB/PqqE/SkfB family radical SAM enzyme